MFVHDQTLNKEPLTPRIITTILYLILFCICHCLLDMLQTKLEVTLV